MVRLGIRIRYNMGVRKARRYILQCRRTQRRKLYILFGIINPLVNCNPTENHTHCGFDALGG